MIAMKIDQLNKKIIIDMGLNIIAAAVPVAMLQLVVYPNIARQIGGEEYGLMLTVYSIWIMISNSLGVVLNNIKLLRFPEYQKIEDEGDVALLLRRWLSASSVIVFAIIWIYCGSFSATHIILGTFVAAFILLKAYLEVGFRIKLDYVAILCNNIILALGFLIGYLMFSLSGVWEFVFLIGYASSAVFCIIKTGLLKEPAKKTNIYNNVRKDAYSLVLAAVITNTINYADKLVLYPLMGGTAVSIYYTATILGKITGMLTGPINSVILSYITHWDNSRARVFSKILALGIGLSVLGYLITLAISRPVINLLFPQWLEQVMEIIPLTTATIMLTILASFLQPFVLRYCKMQWQIGISAIGSAIYFISALILWSVLGLKGFCIGTIIGGISKLAVMVAVYFSNTRNITDKTN